jgi:two-component system sensor histidine kinase DegS
MAPGPAVPPVSGNAAVNAIRAELEADIRRIEEENSEIDMLMEQVLIEIERHEARRVKLEERLNALETDPNADATQLREARGAILTSLRRSMLFDAQRQVLEGKQRVLARFLQRIVEIDNSLAAVTGLPIRPVPNAGVGLRPLATAGAPQIGPGNPEPMQRLRSQEDLRRDIVRRLHDGPAQSLANIALQGEIVERLVRRSDARGIDELASLRQMVQQALDTTKEFIFEVRPMVLDDLGLVPTLRRAAHDRARRSGIPVDFDSHGVERRLTPDLESALFRSIDEAVGGYLALRPPSVVVRLDWSDQELAATIQGTWPRVSSEADATPISGTRLGETPPALLAMMEEMRASERVARLASRSLAPERLAEIAQRARAVGMTVTLREDGQVLELVLPIEVGP